MALDAFSNKQWESKMLAERLRELREDRGMTQKLLAEKVGISESAIRNYELQLASPKKRHLDALAHALGVRPETLRIYDLAKSGNLALNALFQIGAAYGLIPKSDSRFVFLSPTTDFMAEFLSNWENQYKLQLDKSIPRKSYELWKSDFYSEFDPDEFPNRYKASPSGEAVLIEPWEQHCMSQKLRRLRKTRGMKQSDLATASNCTEFAVRSYEQGKRLPKQQAVEDIAAALHVTQDSLTFFDFGSPVQAAHAVFQIAGIFGLSPDVIEGQPVLRTHSAGLERGIQRWAERYTLYQEEGDLDEFLLWQDEYDEDRDRGLGFESRYRAKFIHGRMAGFESDFDPYISAEHAKLRKA